MLLLQNEPRLVQSILSSRNNPPNSGNIRKAKSTDPIKQIDESEEPVKIASYSMEHIVDKTFEDLNESESNRSRKNSESQVSLHCNSVVNLFISVVLIVFVFYCMLNGYYHYPLFMFSMSIRKILNNACSVKDFCFKYVIALYCL